MRTLWKPFQFLYVVYAFLLFVLLMVPVFLWSVFAMLFGRIKGGNMVYRGCMVWADLWFALIFIHHKNKYCYRPIKDRSYIFVANHLSYLDAALVPKVFRRPVRPLGKVEMTKLPLFGTIYKNAIVTVDRGSAGKRGRSIKVMKSILQKGISVLVFPEGTFNETGLPLKEFYDGAFRMAIETGTAILPVLFIDAYDRMQTHSVLSLTPGRSRAVFLPPFEVAGLSLADVPALKQKVHQRMEEELRKRKVTWIKDQEGLFRK